MEAAALVAAINGGIQIVTVLAPLIQQAVQKGEISPEQQQAIQDKLNALRAATAFSGPEWQIDA